MCNPINFPDGFLTPSVHSATTIASSLLYALASPLTLAAPEELARRAPRSRLACPLFDDLDNQGLDDEACRCFGNNSRPRCSGSIYAGMRCRRDPALEPAQRVPPVTRRYPAIGGLVVSGLSLAWSWWAPLPVPVVLFLPAVRANRSWAIFTLLGFNFNTLSWLPYGDQWCETNCGPTPKELLEDRVDLWLETEQV
ncbi:hypothetical protein PG996_004871 [Apiospora saccharicola]|uniref:Uncharacterized protein n=1 Tax=Apiospora saccharicola TaxID=335842 RepID=A0ABR1VNU3_9PEZI